ncbi:hypothetical protein BHE17_11975 [Planococcus maritimus]|uniref:GNAT family N-acetyltransferase n=1 Tax=Planococcus maritimus TaxID=192421 RepID=UPI00084BDA55|nr:GNAT family N-acetyltransferase [Planococcus maritimus]OED33129.1 hypothetical protein BHE17_11975 [Planococcus maritimus]
MKFDLIPLDWDSNYFGVNSAKVVIHEKMEEEEFNFLLQKVKKFEFVTFTNVNNNPFNNFLIGKMSAGFLVDTNMQFQKKVMGKVEPVAYQIESNCKEIYEVTQIASEAFNYSRFFNDPKLDFEAAKNIYYNWVKNSFGRPDKYFILAEEKEIVGFLLFSLKEDNAIIELISLSAQAQGKGVGTKLISALENFAYEKEISSIRVGTQVDNIQAVNFYLNKGFKYNERSSVYHYWPREDFTYE